MPSGSGIHLRPCLKLIRLRREVAKIPAARIATRRMRLRAMDLLLPKRRRVPKLSAYRQAFSRFSQVVGPYLLSGIAHLFRVIE